jgi:hypothetical protein
MPSGTGSSSPGPRRQRAPSTAFVLEVLDTLTIAPGTTPDEVRADLTELERLWREKLAADPQP